MQAGREVDRLAAGARLADDLADDLDAARAAEGLADDWLVVDDEDGKR